ncbi:MAG: hypothetical protein IKN60_02600 [Bacteroidales bacterium]|nr:hypothetical protein [Bacteroidales bacterium]
MKRSFADIMAGLDTDRAQKVARKLPAWAAVDGLEIPSALALEQCSSSATAAYKANLAVSTSRSGQLPPETSGCAGPLPSDDGPLPLTMPRVARFPGAVPASVPPGTVLDLTGGLGVDSWALSQVAERVVYFERNEELAAAAGRNFQRLGAGNIEVRCETVTPQTALPEADLIYADPARRDAAGRKVFLLEDCTPDILTLLPMLLKKAPAVLLKLSPMADLAMLAERLGPALREIHVVECDGEVKEILCLLLRDNVSPEPDILVARLFGQAAAVVQQGESLRFRVSEERAAEPVYAAGVQPGDVLLEPCPALLKAGAFRLPCARWGLSKLAPSTHLYTGAYPPEPPAAINPFPTLQTQSPGAGRSADADFASLEHAAWAPFFKAWRVVEVLPLGAAAFKTLRKSYPRADVTARNLPMGSAELQKRLGVASGGTVHIFGCRLADGSSVLLVTESA